MYILFLPYLLQLLCIVHVIKTHRNTYWIWIIIGVPYAGGLAYLLIEMLPDLLSASKMDTVKDTLVGLIKPDEKFEIIRQKAMYSSTHKNMIEYADALMARNSFTEALGIYTDQNKGAFLNDQELIYRIALAEYSLGNHEKALEHIAALMKSSSSFAKKSRENLLYLLIIEQLKDRDAVKDEYIKTLRLIQNNSIELQYIDFLLRIGDTGELLSLFAKIHLDEQSMKINKFRYDRRFYNSVYRIERNVMQKGKEE